jgi:hypothetical protein
MTSRFEKPMLALSSVLTTILLALLYFAGSSHHSLPWLVMLILSFVLATYAITRLFIARLG